jgi:spore coat protein CotF
MNSMAKKLLLEDSKSHEEQCIKKYANYTALAADDELKAVFRSNGKKEEEHLQTINQLLNGKLPSISQQNGGGQQQQQQPNQQPGFEHKTSSSTFNGSDKDLCMDMLMTEKYVSGAYDTAIYEFRDANIRDILNHIQKEEQKHGEAIFTYMENKGMYQAQ